MKADWLQWAVRAVDPRLTSLVRDERGYRSALSAALPRGASVTMVGLPGGVGASTTAAMVALALAEHRGERVLAIDADPGAGLRARLGVAAGADSGEVLHRLSTSDGPPVGYRWVRQRLASLTGPQLLTEPLTGDGYALAVRRLRRWFHLLLTDVSSTRHAPALPAVLRSTDRLVVVGSADPWGLDLVRRGLPRLAALADRPLDISAVCALVQAPDSAKLKAETAADSLGMPVHVIPFDPAAAATPLTWDGLAYRTRFAALGLAAAAVSDLPATVAGSARE